MDTLALVVLVAVCLLPFVRAALTFLGRHVIEACFPEERASCLLRSEACFPEERALGLLSEAFSSERKQAAEHAHRLLERNLNADQQRTFATSGFIDVRASGGRVYRLARSGSGGRLSEDEKSLTAAYCIVPTVSMPLADRLLALKLMLETEEEEFLRTAHYLGRPG